MLRGDRQHFHLAYRVGSHYRRHGLIFIANGLFSGCLDNVGQFILNSADLFFANLLALSGTVTAR